MPSRGTASVVVPFAGTGEELSELIARLAALRLQPDDQLILADNRPAAAANEPYVVGPVTVLPAGGIRSPGFARNRGAAAATGQWLVFIDADTEPDPGLLDAYLDPRPDDDVAVLAGEIIDVPPSAGEAGSVVRARASIAARHVVARGQMNAAWTAERPAFSYAQSANCAVRRSAFIAAGGFDELARAGEDADLCFRLAAAGHRLQRRETARVNHRARAALPGLLRQLAVHGAGAAWCEARYPGSFPAPSPVSLAARLGHGVSAAARALAGGDRERAAFAAVEIAEALAFESGRLRSNQAKVN